MAVILLLDLFLQKQFPEGVQKKKYPCETHWEIPVSESLFNKVAGFQANVPLLKPLKHQKTRNF